MPQTTKLIVTIVALIVVAIIAFSTISYLTGPNTPQSTQPASHTTTVYPLDNSAHVDDDSITGVIVDISGDSLPGDVYFNVTTTYFESTVPTDAKHPLNVGVNAFVRYYDVRVQTNATLTPDIKAKLTFTNTLFNQQCNLYFWNSTLSEWTALSTQFQSPHKIIGSLPVSALTGTPFGITDGGATPTPAPSQTSSSPSPSPSPSNAPAPDSTLSPTATPTVTPTTTPNPSPSQSNEPTPTANPTGTSTASPTPNPSPPAPPIVAPEYFAGALVSLLICMAGYGVFRVVKTKHDPEP